VKKQKDVEYVTRIICHSMRDLSGRQDLNEFLDKSMMDIIDKEDICQIVERFEGVVELIWNTGEDALMPKHGRRKLFTLQGLESVLVGVSRNFEAISALQDSEGYVARRINEFWESDVARVYTSSGMSAPERIRQTVPLGDEWFNPGAA
jgi:hypothetical protein